MPRPTTPTPNYTTRRANERKNRKTVPAPPPIVRREHNDDLVRFYAGEKTWALPRISQIRADEAKYAARIGLRPGPEFEAYIRRNIERVRQKKKPKVEK